jgi:hypothetical protein
VETQHLLDPLVLAVQTQVVEEVLLELLLVVADMLVVTEVLV